MKERVKRGTPQLIMVFLLTLVMVISVFAYFPIRNAKADGGYILTFIIDDEVTGDHTIEVEGEHLRIDGVFVDLKSGEDTIGNVYNDLPNEATINVDEDTVGKLDWNSDKFELYLNDGTKITADTEFSTDETIVVKDAENSDGENNESSVEIQFDNDATRDGNVLTFTFGDVQITANVTGVAGEVAQWSEGAYLTIDRNHLGDVIFALSDSFNKDTMSVMIIGENDYHTPLVISDTNTCSLGGLNIPGNQIHFEIQNGQGGGGGDPQPAGDTNAVINLSGPIGSWTVVPKVEEEYDINSEEGCSAPYADYAYTVSVSINGGQRTRGVNQYNKDDKAGYASSYGSQNISYNRGMDTEGNPKTMVDIDFFSNWSNRIESVKINNQSYDIPLNYDDRNAWLNAFNGQGIGFTIENVPVSTEKDTDGNEIYNIVVQVRPITEEECFIGNFLWSNDDRMDPSIEGNEYNDMYIGHSNLELLSITYDDGTGEKTVDYEDLLDENGNETIPFIHQSYNVNAETGIEMGEMVVPEGSWVTMKIETKYGYQVKSFNVTGEDIRLGDTSVFSFRIGKGNFHIGAHVEEQGDEAKVDADAVSDAAVELAEGTLDTGSARLEVADAEISDEKKAEFESLADEAGLEIETYLDLELNQVFYKGTGNPDDVWANPMNDLEGAATIALALSEDIDPEAVTIIHNIHNGEEFEIIETEYIEEYNAIAFETDSFSDYAIATKSENETTEETTSETTTEETTSETTTEETTSETTTEETTSETTTEKISATEDTTEEITTTTEITTAEVTTPSNNEATTESTSVKQSPKTGDEMMMFVILLLISSVGMGVMIKIGHRKN